MAFGTLMNNSKGIKILSENFDTLCLSKEVTTVPNLVSVPGAGVYRWRNIPGCITALQIIPNIRSIFFIGNDLTVNNSNQWSTPASVSITYYSGATANLPLRYIGPSRFIGSKTGTYGMQMFNSAGQITLDARDNILNTSKIIKLNQNVTQSGAGTSTGTVNYPITNNAWFAVCRWRQWFEAAVGAGFGVDYGIQRVSQGSTNWRAKTVVYEEPGTSVSGGGDFGYYTEFTIQETTTTYKLGTLSKDSLKGVHPKLVSVVERAIEITDR